MSAELSRDLHVLISIAKIDAQINDNRQDLARLPAQLDKVKRTLADVESREGDAKANLEDMARERRELEQGVEDNTAKITKYKNQLMEVKTNKEYTAMLHEIEHIEKDTEEKEERLLILMDELDQRGDENKQLLEQSTKQKEALHREIVALEEKVKELEAGMSKLEGEKPKLLMEINPQIKKRYDRVLAKLGDYAVTHMEDDRCQGCFTRIPPQRAVEIRKNDKMIACEACGRMLVYYDG